MEQLDITMNTSIHRSPVLRAGIRQPQRQRGVDRFEILLDAAETKLVEAPDEDITLSMIAKAAKVPLPSVYHFFPNRNAILVALAQRFHKDLAKITLVPLDPPPVEWQEIVRRRQQNGAAYLNAHPAALRLFMGAGVSVEVRNLDLQGNASLAHVRAEDFRSSFSCGHIPELERVLAVSIGLMDGIWAISYSEHSRITDHYLNESIRATIAYLRCYLPEVLTPRRI